MDLMEIQRELEETMESRGVDRFERLAREARESGQASRVRSEQTAMDSAIVMVAEAVDAFRGAAKTGGAGRRHSAIRRIGDLPAEVLAFITLRALLDNSVKTMKLVSTACTIGRSIEMEARLAVLAEKEAAYLKTVTKDLDSRTRHTGHRRAVLSKVLREKGGDIPQWPERDHLLVGMKMIELVVESTGLFEVVHQARTGSRRGRVLVLQTTARFRDWLGTLDQQLSLLHPEFLPAVVPPKDWTGLDEGGYLTDALSHPPKLVKTTNKDHQELIREADLSVVLGAVNAIQRTPWQINVRVLNVAETLTEEGRPVAGLPDMEDLPLPTQPEDIDTNPETLTQWKMAAAATYQANSRIVGKRIEALRSLHMAREFAHYDRIYFPHQLDFRGRIYPLPSGVTPQGSDLAKGLLRFADGEPLDTAGARKWFYIHGANTYGIDDVSFDEREKWVDENAEHIIRSAEDPLGYQWWADADSPFCFLAWAFEFNDWTATGCSPEFVSHVPVAMDGSCNGLQHYSAMLRDPRAGAATNLIPSDKPQDIYKEVANEVMDRLADIALREHDPHTYFTTDEEREKFMKEVRWASEWGAMGITRDITKRPVMVLPYGGTQLACIRYTSDAVAERPDCPFRGDELRPASTWLAQRVWESIGNVVVSARLAMGWLQDAARAATKAGHDVRWVSPVGFPVVQAYNQTKLRRIDTQLLGARAQPALRHAEEGVLDSRRQANGVAPNFVHSMDAAALMLTVDRLAKEGATNFAMIHDSYGTTAKGAAGLAHVLREAFVDLYTHNNVLEDFAERLQETAGVDAGTPPFVGGLDLEQVKESPYFFA